MFLKFIQIISDIQYNRTFKKATYTKHKYACNDISILYTNT